MEKKKSAGLKEAMVGLSVKMVSDANMTIDDLKKCIVFTDEKPFFEIKGEDVYVGIYEKIKEWIEAIIGSSERCEEFLEKLSEFPEKAANIGANVKDEMENSDLGVWD